MGAGRPRFARVCQHWKGFFGTPLSCCLTGKKGARAGVCAWGGGNEGAYRPHERTSLRGIRRCGALELGWRRLLEKALPRESQRRHADDAAQRHAKHCAGKLGICGADGQRGWVFCEWAEARCFVLRGLCVWLADCWGARLFHVRPPSLGFPPPAHTQITHAQFTHASTRVCARKTHKAHPPPPKNPTAFAAHLTRGMFCCSVDSRGGAAQEMRLALVWIWCVTPTPTTSATRLPSAADASVVMPSRMPTRASICSPATICGCVCRGGWS